MNRHLVQSDCSRRSAFYSPVSAHLKTTVAASGSPSMLDRRRHALAVPISWAGRVNTALIGAGYVVHHSLFEGAA